MGAASAHLAHELPAEPVDLRCVVRKPHNLELEWVVKDPSESLAVTACEIHVTSGGWTGTWTPAEFEASGHPCRVQQETWRAHLAGLASGSTYGIRIRARNVLDYGPWSGKSMFSTSEVPSQPYNITCITRMPTKIVMEWQINDPDNADVHECDIQYSTSVIWAQASVEGAAKRVSPDSTTWRVCLCNLSGDTAYEVRLKGKNIVGDGPWSPGYEVRTSPRPGPPSAMQCVRRHANSLDLEWCVADPEGAPVTNCEVQLAGSVSWISASHPGGGVPSRVRDNVWSATVMGLASNTSYNVGVRAVNTVGAGFWSQETQFKTSVPPEEPYGIRMACRRVDSISLEWTVDDPEGAEVKSCEVEVAGSLSWTPVSFTEIPQRRCDGQQVWSAVVAGLTANTAYDVRLRGISNAGHGKWSATQALKTSESPGPPLQLRCVSRKSDRLCLEWKVADPEGAEVTRCELHIGSQFGWSPAVFATTEGASVPQRTGTSTAEDGTSPVGTWSCELTTLTGDTSYALRVRGLNEAGIGAWSDIAQLRTSSVPACPFDVRCARRLPNELVLEWGLEEPEGAEVQGCEVQVGTSLGWKVGATSSDPNHRGAATVDNEDMSCPVPRRIGGERWRAAVKGLEGNTMHTVRICGVNQAGGGQWSSQLQFKTSEVPSAPHSMRVLKREAENLTLQWTVVDPEGAPVTHCDLHVANALSWDKVQGAEPRRVQGEVWEAIMSGLQGNTVYKVCVRGQSLAGEGAWMSPFQVMTSHRPEEPDALRCTYRYPSLIELQWRVADPEGAPVSSCDVEFAAGMTWEKGLYEPDQAPRRVEGDLWQAAIGSLKGCTTYQVRTRGVNVAGAGLWSATKAFKTSEAPAAPAVKCTARRPDGFALEWYMADPEGAAVLSSEVQMSAGLTWVSPLYTLEGEPHRGDGGHWHASISELQGNTSYKMRVRGRNAAGEGVWSELVVPTSSVPQEPTKFRVVRRLAHTLELEWELAQPDGAEVLDCEVHVADTLGWSPAEYAADRAPTQVRDGVWQTTIAGLLGDAAYNLRMRGRNVVGAGIWSQQTVFTSGRLEKPTDLSCTARFADKLSLRWRVEGTEGAPVTSCQVQVCSGLTYVDAEYDPNHGEPVREADSDYYWAAHLVSLTGGCEYKVRVRGRNAAGDGQWMESRISTSMVPEAPTRLSCTRCFGDGLSLRWHVEDPEGAPVTGCEVQTFGALMWTTSVYDVPPGREVDHEPTWRATITSLEPDAEYGVRVRALNCVGAGAWGERKDFTTQGKPSKVTDFAWCHSEMHAVTLEWTALDPDGSDVFRCEVESLVHPSYASPYWAASTFAEGGEPFRVTAGQPRWRTKLGNLVASTTYGVRVRAVNSAGGGPWLRQQVKTSDVPVAPHYIRCGKADKTRLELEWYIADPEGGKITVCEVQIKSFLAGWSEVTYEAGGEPARTDKSGQCWRASVGELAPATKHEFRIRGRSVAGAGAWGFGAFDSL